MKSKKCSARVNTTTLQMIISRKSSLNECFALEDGEVVQRDWYSSFLLYNANPDFSAPDRETCLKTFGTLNEMHIKMIDYIKHAGIHVLNSGIAC